MTDLIFFVVAVAGFTGQFFDCITTDAGISAGWKELSGASALIIKKFGITGLFVTKCVLLGIATPVLMYSLLPYGSVSGSIVAGVAAVAGFYAGIVNYKKLKAAKISVF